MSSMLLHNTRYALRQMVRNRLTTLVLIVTLGLGTGVNVAIFSVLYAVALRPLPYPAPEELVAVWEAEAGGREDIPIADGNLLDLYLQSKSLSDFAAYASTPGLVGVGDTTVRTTIAAVTRDFFSTFRVQPTLGRSIAAEEYGAGTARTAVIGHDFWTTVFGGDPQVLGKEIFLYGEPATVVGVMPPAFRFPVDAAVWIDYERYLGGSRSAHNSRAVARLAPGVTLDQARGELAAIARGLQQAYPNEVDAGVRFAVRPLHEDLVGNTRATLRLLFGVVVAILLIACGNIAGILLARSLARRGEFGMRQALGAGLRHLVVQLLLEAMLLGLLGALLGLLLARWSLGLLNSWLPATLLPSGAVTIDSQVVGWALLLGLVTGLLCGFAPIFWVLRNEPLRDLRSTTGISTRGGSPRRLGGLIVIPQYAFSLAALVVAGLLLKSFWLLVDVDPGFDKDGMVTAEVTLPPSPRYDDLRDVASFYHRLLAELQETPGVEGVTLVHSLPLSGTGINGVALREEDPQPTAEQPQFYPDYRVVGNDYFRIFNIRLLSGRDFRRSDDESAPLVAIVSERLAGQMWPNADAVGERLVLPGLDFDAAESARPLTVVGVATDVLHSALDETPRPAVYVPWTQHLSRSRTLNVVASLAAGSDQGLAILRQKIHGLDPGLPLGPVRTIEDWVRASTAAPRFRAGLLSLFAGLALLLAMLGLYGVTSYSVSKRRREVAIRIALGASRWRVERLLLKEGLLIVLLGQALGTIAAVLGVRLLEGLLFGVETTDLVVFTIVSLNLVTVALVTAYLPGRRATRIETATILHQE